MTPTLHYRPRSGGTTVDLDRLVASRMLVQANSGAGKSRAIRQLLEETFGRVQHIVIDPEGEFATLREKFGYVLAAGREGDTAAHPKTARVLCRTLVELGASAVLDLYDLELPHRREFVRLFLTELMALPRTLWRPILVVIDEAHVFCPERASGDATSTDSVITLCTQGRKRGFCAVLATQRISKLHKDAAAELLNKLVGRTGLDVDVKRAGDELGFDKEERQSLKMLAPGEFFVYGPAISQTVVKVRTGEVTTSHPEAGTIGVAPPPAPAAIQKILERLRDIPQEAEAEARTLADLEKRNRELAAQVRKLEKGAPASAQPPKIIERTVIDQAAIDRAVAGVRREYEKANADVTRIAQSLVSQAAKLAPFAEQIAERLSAVKVPALTPVASNGHRPAPAPVVRPTRVATRTEPAEGLSGTQQRMLNAMVFYEQIGVDAPTREQVAGYCGISAAGGSYSNNLSTLRTRGLMVDADSNRVSLTDEGRALAQSEPPPSLDRLHDTWRGKLSGTQARMLDEIIAAYPDAISRETIADRIGVSASGGSYSNNLSRLRTLGLMVDVSRTDVKGSAVLFPDGLT